MVKHSKKKKLKAKYLIRRIMCVLVLIVLLMITSSFMNRENKFNQLVLSKTENGTIDFEENEFYKKYTIDCTEAITNFKPKEDIEKFQITLDKSKISNIDIKNGTKVNLSEINFEEDKNLFILDFVKLTEDENYVHLAYGNDKKILIFIKKKQNPFKYKVVVDPGHGGVDVGAKYGDLFEKDLNLKISEYMVDNLRYNGCRVIFTRNTDVELDKLVTKDLNKRADLANNENADVFVSVHINSNTSNEYKGVSTYYYDDVNYKQKDKGKFAGVIQEELLKSGTWTDMGIHGGGLAVLRLTKMPSILVECGFITNYEDRGKLSSDNTLVGFGLNISNGIMKYLSETD
ncbi:N-acetylmuramoyl-L-alanine amidase [Clostridium sp.]|uniref:N-acetylmuramoyl-L-alanine amidase family protein n=1 Tax=Clostridium sp. TaxID=1506 RepID=UPI001A47D013|nr:N-acetylmuramoyl-L-alanine amidase [Clostridium sp.]MBK5240678.1 N-acetylmuramoyl-L-alanine amidase [Clostridium sp.]